ncbi:hypothetical protein CRG98_023958 [Punica granatum]|uniref:Uncharacterized protein n=1 Tax=Punica granatum TaxID=22663 RepID=A0A2I0JHC0_PUNGR|nr:hypothetical protein CRG98_023958 [Punica granatum]
MGNQEGSWARLVIFTALGRGANLRGCGQGPDLAKGSQPALDPEGKEDWALDPARGSIAVPQALKQGGLSPAASPEGSRAERVASSWLDSPPLFPCYSISKQVVGSPASPRLLLRGGRAQATLPWGSRVGGELSVGSSPCPLY